MPQESRFVRLFASQDALLSAKFIYDEHSVHSSNLLPSPLTAINNALLAVVL